MPRSKNVHSVAPLCFTKSAIDRSSMSSAYRALFPHGTASPCDATCSWMICLATSGTQLTPRCASSRSSEVFPAPGPPLMTYRFGLLMIVGLMSSQHDLSFESPLDHAPSPLCDNRVSSYEED